ncbi:Yop proteins translocation protein L [bacterium HR15]|nr:Yop proteins translocation protein L [bacterium HR15]
MKLIPLVGALKRGEISSARSSPPPAPAALPELSELKSLASSPEQVAARQQADALLQQARAEAEQIRQQAHQQGYREGYQAGEQEAYARFEAAYQEQIAQLREEVNAFLCQLQAQFDEYLRLLEAQMLELTLQIARKVIRDEMRQQPEHVLAVIRDTLRRVQGFGKVRVRVNPLDLELARQQKPMLLTVVDTVEGLEIVEDRRVDQGGCLIETPQGIYDARISTQLDEIERELREALPEAG